MMNVVQNRNNTKCNEPSVLGRYMVTREILQVCEKLATRHKFQKHHERVFVLVSSIHFDYERMIAINNLCSFRKNAAFQFGCNDLILLHALQSKIIFFGT
jgi:hypothetical protein